MLITNTVMARAKNHRKNDLGTGDKLVYGLCCYQGLRYEMEDAHCAYPVIQCLRGWSFFGVFDGHGGSLCSSKVSDHLVDHIFKQIFARAGIDTSHYMLLREFKLSSAEAQKVNNLDVNVIAKAIEEGFLSMDRHLLEIEEIKQDDDKSGTTVICSLITNTHVFLINCGDSRGMLCKSGRVEVSTFDHKPTNRKERQRIQDAGGMVALQRVNGGLATSRGLGDFEYKNVAGLPPDKQYVSPIPDVTISDRESSDEFIVLACDGIWDVMSNEDVLKFVRERVNIEPLDRLSENLLDCCIEKVSSFPSIHFIPSINYEIKFGKNH